MTYRGHINSGIVVLDEAGAGDLPDGTPVVIQPVGSFGFHEDLTLAQLAERQPVRAIVEVSDLAGDWPPEDSLDEFLAAVREGRR